jgi:outer membrane protein assembly factor BamB
LKKNTLFFIFCFVYSFVTLLGDENIDLLTTKFPSVLVKYSTLGTPNKKQKIVWSRTDMLEIFSINQITCKDNQILIKNDSIEFLTPEKSNADVTDYYGRVGKLPLVVYKWEIEVEAEGTYILNLPIELGSFGFLNNDMVITISNGILSKKKSGKQSLQLLKGKNVLYIATKARSNNQLALTSEADTDRIKNEIVKKITSTSKEDIEWVIIDFIPFLQSLQNGIYSFIIAEISRINKSRPFVKNDATATLLKSFVSQNYTDGYMIEKYIYTNFPELYFHFLKSVDPKKSIGNSFISTNNEPRFNFLQQLISDGQKILAEKYFNQCESTITSFAEYEGKEKFISALYSTRFIAFFRIGRIREANEVLKITQEKCKPFPLSRFIESRPDQEDTVTLTQSFDETNAFQIKENVDSYEGTPDQLASLYKTFLGLNNNLVKRNDGAVSTSYLFHVCKNLNEKLKTDIEKYCLEKIQDKIKKCKETKDIKLLEETIETFEVITPLPEIRLILMEEYFNCGAIAKALSQAHLIFEKYPLLRSKIIAKMIILETISEIDSEQLKKIPDELRKAEIKILGQTTTIGKLISQQEAQENNSKSIGKLIKTIPLEPIHSQYTNHTQINEYQPIEPLFTKNNIIFNGGSYLLNYSVIKNEMQWDYHSKSEYKKESENGPHQKRFITQHSGNQLFMFTNRDNSGQKSVKSFDLKGNLLWDMSDQSISLIEEPLCTPIESQGKLFGLSYSNRETINTVSYCVYDSSTGKLITRTPISYMPTSARDSSCGGIGLSWNSFTHDNHFTQDDSFVYGYSGTGIIFKADSNSGNLLWEKGFPKSSVTGEYDFFNTFGSGASGYIKIFGDTLLCFAPDLQVITALNKNTGDYIWRSIFKIPRYFHDRGKSEFLYFSTASINNEAILYKVNPQNGETIWQSPTNGLIIAGEGDILGDKLYIPSEKSILEFDKNSGKLVNVIPLNIQPLKIRCNNLNTVVLSANTAFIFNNNGTPNLNEAKEVGPKLTVAKFFEPDAPPASTISFENINLETTLKISETFYTSSNRWKKTQLVKTSKPYHFLLKCKENLTLFREGYFQKSGLYIPPEIIWFGQYPCHSICEDTIYVSEPGKITASNLFTRESLWVYEYDKLSPAIRNSWNKASPIIAVTKQYIAFQTENQTIRILDTNT